jgi:hypothetical protein
MKTNVKYERWRDMCRKRQREIKKKKHSDLDVLFMLLVHDLQSSDET